MCVRCIKLVSFNDFSIRFRNCSDSVVFCIFPFISRIVLLYLGTVPTVWYFSFYFYDFSIRLLNCSDNAVFFYYSFYFYDFSIRFMNCSDSVVFFIFPFISTIFLLNLGTVLTVWYFILFLFFLRFFY